MEWTISKVHSFGISLGSPFQIIQPLLFPIWNQNPVKIWFYEANIFPHLTVASWKKMPSPSTYIFHPLFYVQTLKEKQTKRAPVKHANNLQQQQKSSNKEIYVLEL